MCPLSAVCLFDLAKRTSACFSSSGYGSFYFWRSECEKTPIVDRPARVGWRRAVGLLADYSTSCVSLLSTSYWWLLLLASVYHSIGWGSRSNRYSIESVVRRSLLVGICCCDLGISTGRSLRATLICRRCVRVSLSQHHHHHHVLQHRKFHHSSRWTAAAASSMLPTTIIKSATTGASGDSGCAPPSSSRTMPSSSSACRTIVPLIGTTRWRTRSVRAVQCVWCNTVGRVGGGGLQCSATCFFDNGCCCGWLAGCTNVLLTHRPPFLATMLIWTIFCCRFWISSCTTRSILEMNCWRLTWCKFVLVLS